MFFFAIPFPPLQNEVQATVGNQATQTATGSGWIVARVACQDVLHLHKPEPVGFYSKASNFVWNQICGNKMAVAVVNT
jgi:hypothetical protein